MKNLVIILSLLIIWMPLNAAQEPEILFFLKAGATKTFKISEIDSMNIQQTGDSSVVTIIDGAGGKHTFDADGIKRIFFSDSTKIAFDYGDSTVYHNLNDIDSIAIDTYPQSSSDFITIGTQSWTAKNLSVSFYRNGDSIPHIEDPVEWAALTTGAWRWYNDDQLNESSVGKLYNWFAVTDPRGIAPAGCHIPDVDEWQALVDFLGGDSLAGGKLKETGTLHWQSPNTGATNESKFTALPGGFCNFDGTFSMFGLYGIWWTSERYDAKFAHGRYMSNTDAKATKFVVRLLDGLSVRCVKD